jgi:hypothetical protein
MKNIISALFGIGILLGISERSQAIVIKFDPAVVTSSYSIGDTVDIAITVSGLGNMRSPSIGAFDLYITYSSYVLDFSSLTFGDPAHGDQLDFSDFDLPSLGFAGYVEYGSRVVNLFEVSLDPIWLLDLRQTDFFTLATLTFDILNNGKSVLDISNLNSVFSDADGNVLPVTIIDGKISVPEPAIYWLFGSGFLGIYIFNKRIDKRIKLSAINYST